MHDLYYTNLEAGTIYKHRLGGEYKCIKTRTHGDFTAILTKVGGGKPFEAVGTYSDDFDRIGWHKWIDID